MEKPNIFTERQLASVDTQLAFDPDILDSDIYENPSADLDELPASSERRDRFWRSSPGRFLLRLGAIAGLMSAGVTATALPASAENITVQHVYDTEGEGLWLHPSSATIHSGLGDLMVEGQAFDAQCFVAGDNVNGDTVWLYGTNEATGHSGYVADYYMDTDDTRGNEAQQLPQHGIPECGTERQAVALPEPNVKACFFNLKAPSTELTLSYSDQHRYYGNAWQAAKDWTDLNTGLKITALQPGNDDVAYIRLKDMYSRADDWYAKTEIPATTDWQGPFNTPPRHPHIPASITIDVNQYWMDKLDDFHRTYTLVHEIGHALGLAHPDAVCGVSDKSIMDAGGKDVPQRSYNTPQFYDRIELEELYGLPIH